MPETLETERLLLRRFTPADAESLFALDSDPEVMRWLTGGDPTPRDVIDRQILPRFLGPGFWAAIEKDTGAFVGWFSLRADGDTVKLGYRLRRDAWGKGYATEGARALLERSDARRIVATTYEKNVASQRVLEKLGFTLVRRFRLTPGDLAQVDTFAGDPTEIWDGDDLEYVLERDALYGTMRIL